MSELVEKGDKMLRDGLESPKANPSKLNESICAQLCEAGLDALTRATRYHKSFFFFFFHRYCFFKLISAFNNLQILL